MIVGIVLIAFQNQGSDLLGSDSTNQGGSQPAADEFSQIASLSVQGLVKNAPGKVFAIEVTNDSLSARYFQLFNLTTVTVPSRAASQSSATALKIYKASTSWASTASLVDKPLGSYLVYASRSLVFSAIIPGATASADRKSVV